MRKYLEPETILVVAIGAWKLIQSQKLRSEKLVAWRLNIEFYWKADYQFEI